MIGRQLFHLDVLKFKIYTCILFANSTDQTLLIFLDWVSIIKIDFSHCNTFLVFSYAS